MPAKASWHSNKPSVAQVDSSGVVTAVAVGLATITATADTVTTATDVTVAPSGITVIAFADFEDGTFGPFYNPWASVGGIIDVIADPTPRATGKVARMRYANNPPGQIDSNLGLMQSGDVPMTFGDHRIVEGDFYLPRPPAGTELQQRKLLVNYGQESSGDGALVTAWNQSADPSFTQLVFAFGSGGAKPPIYSTYGIVNPLSWDAWHHLKAEYKIESVPGGTDGTADIYCDGVHAFSATGLTWINNAAGFTQINGPGFGYQYNSTIKTDEVRYWDNISWSKVTP
jgi:hypothetical protein